MAGSRWLALAAVLLAAASGVACRKRAAGTCAEDIDCPAGYDCRSAACIKRPPPPGTATAPVPGPEGEQPPSPGESSPPAPGPVDASPPADAASVNARPKRKAAPPSPTAPPPTLPAAPPEGPLPMWKQRRKNS